MIHSYCKTVNYSTLNNNAFNIKCSTIDEKHKRKTGNNE